MSNTVQRGDWSICLIEDSDGHLNIYIENDKSERLYDIDDPCMDAELQYRITTDEIEQAYLKGTHNDKPNSFEENYYSKF